MTCSIFRGDSAVRQKDHLVATAWLDNQVVNVLSTNVQPDAVGTIKRTMKDGTKGEFRCPQAVISYSENMAGVDMNDQLRQYYSIRMKSRKYYKYIFWFLLEVACTNAFILYWLQGGHNTSLRDFRLAMAKEFIGNYCSRKQPGRTIADVPVVRGIQQMQHYAMKKRTDSKKGVSRCKLCASKHIKRETVWYCEICCIHLCHTGENDGSDCFRLYHEQLLI